MDMVMRMPHFPAAGETVSVEDGGASYLPDGRGGNCAVALAKLGARSVFCCRVGEDIHGQRLHALYGEAGIDTSPIVADPRTPTGLNVIMTDDGKVPRNVIYPGANANLTRDNLTPAFATNPDACLLQLDLPEETVLDAARRAAERHIPIFLDAAPGKRDFPFSRLPELEVFSPNEQETELYTGIRPGGSDTCLKAMLELVKVVKAHYYIIKMADRGAFLFDGRHFNLISTYIVKMVDGAGAGDAFMAGLALEYMRTRGDISAACKFANTVGAITVMRAGTVSSFPTDAEVQSFIARNGTR
jgi:ribokinase